MRDRWTRDRWSVVNGTVNEIHERVHPVRVTAKHANCGGELKQTRERCGMDVKYTCDRCDKDVWSSLEYPRIEYETEP